MSTRIVGFDLGLEGSVVRLIGCDDTVLGPIVVDVTSWNLKKVVGDDNRYWQFFEVAYPAILWADVAGYERVQFNRGKSFTEGMRALIHVASRMDRDDRLVHGVNVATLDAFIRKACGFALPADLKQKGMKKERSLHVLQLEHPLIASACSNDNEVDAAWTALYVADQLLVEK